MGEARRIELQRKRDLLIALRTAQATDEVFNDAISLIDDAIGDLDGTREKKILDTWAELAAQKEG